jgi:anti-sigma factor RsiW
MLECIGMGELLSAFRDGELEADKVAIVTRHLATCAKCEALLSEIYELGETLRANVEEPSLDGFTEQVLTRITALREPFYRRVCARLAALDWKWPVAVTSASLATALVGWLALITFIKPASVSIVPAESRVAEEVKENGSELAQALGLVNLNAKHQVVISRLETDQHHVA